MVFPTLTGNTKHYLSSPPEMHGFLADTLYMRSQRKTVGAAANNCYVKLCMRYLSAHMFIGIKPSAKAPRRQNPRMMLRLDEVRSASPMRRLAAWAHRGYSPIPRATTSKTNQHLHLRLAFCRLITQLTCQHRLSELRTWKSLVALTICCKARGGHSIGDNRAAERHYEVPAQLVAPACQVASTGQ